jgi:NitT/TauT family transport system ATP-binding protein
VVPADPLERSDALVEARGVTLQYRNETTITTAVYRVSFAVGHSDRFVLLGPSGCGKSTLLKAIGGFIDPTEGELTIDGRPIDGPSPDRAFVFQEFDQLLPWKTVVQNVSFALTAGRRLARREAEERARHFVAKVGLSQFGDSYPHMLSGGMKQRVAIARAMASEPRVLLMDEPFAALDALTRDRMQVELLRLCEESRFSVVFVTHSIPEAIRLGTRILVLTPHPGQARAELDCTGQDAPDASGRALSARISDLLFDHALPAGAVHV